MIDQFFIGVFGLLSIFLVNDPRASVRRWAPIFGLCGQPFWFYSSWQAQQWGIFALAIAYSIGWWRGLRHQWLSVPI